MAAPVTWEELHALADGRPFTIADADALLTRAAGKALAGWGEAEQTLPDL